MADFGDVIAIIPGIFGSRLEREDGRLLYDLTLAALPRTLWTLSGAGLSALNRNAPLDDGVVATDFFNYQLLPGFFGNDDYDTLLAMLRASVKHPDQQVIKFPYDWRGSNRWSAERFDRVARDALHAWKATSGNADAKLWLICHSMGGLVARYFCEHLGGADITRELITIGTPHRGAVKALEVLANGMKLAGLIDVSQFLRSLPSVYELLPQHPVLRKSSGDRAIGLAAAYGLDALLAVPRDSRAVSSPEPGRDAMDGLASLDPVMVERAIDFHAAIRNPVVKRMDEGAPGPYALRCFLNRRQRTVLSAQLQGDTLEASEVDPLSPSGVSTDPDHRGDGTVAAFSAVPIEWADTSAAIAVSAKHVGMPSSTAVLDVLRNWIRPQDVRAYLGVHSRDVLALQAPSAIQQGDELSITIDALAPANITVTLQAVAGGGPAHSVRKRVPGNGSPVTVDLGTPSDGTWRVTATAEDRRRPPVSDYVLVVSRE